jgi:hypothetical protein
MAMSIGCFAGLMDGLWGTHRWAGPGLLGFPLDMTWGLAGTSSACVLHLLNLWVAGHADEPRQGVHRYREGARFRKSFALTLGAVMSNTGDESPGTELWRHEQTHVWQNRIFGPLYILTYAAWMAIFVIPALVSALVTKRNVRRRIEAWTYFNNPWEAWAYRVGCGPRIAQNADSWSDRSVWMSAIVVGAGVVLLLVLVFRPGSNPS